MKTILMSAVAATLMLLPIGAANADEGDRCHIAWSHYTGWELAGYIQDTGIADRVGTKHGVDLQFKFTADYLQSINMYTAGTFDGVTITNMDALTIPAIGGKDTTLLVAGDTSNGNDGILVRGVSSVEELKDQKVTLVGFSVSHYMLARALDKAGLSELDVQLINLESETDIPGLMAVAGEGEAFVTWNPILKQGTTMEGFNLIFDSSQIPGEIIDTVAVATNVSDACKAAVTEAWYAGTKIMGDPSHPEYMSSIEFMADQAGGSLADFVDQLDTTNMMYTPSEGEAFARSPQVIETMEAVRQFAFEQALFAETDPTPDVVGIAFPDGTILGDPNNVKLRIDAEFMGKAAREEL